MKKSPYRILVTGGAGFLGSHLCDRLVSSGHEVVCLDNFYTGSELNIEHLLENPRFELIRHDVCDPVMVDVDAVYHLAWPASPVHYERNPVRTIRSCVQGTLNMLDLCRAVDARLLLASTSEVYGDPAKHPQSEEYWGHVNPIGPRSCYDEGKRCAEALVVSYAAQYHTECRIGRIFNVYGPRLQADDGRVVSTFIVQALRGEPLTVFGDGQQTRSFCYVDDLIDGLVKLMESDVREPVNLGNPNEITIRELAGKIIDLSGSRASLVHRQLPVDDPVRRRPDITRARERLGWSPATGLEDGLRSTISYFRNTVGPSVKALQA